MALNGKQKRQLRALGHHLSVVVQVGSDGVTEGVIGAVTQALKDHELIKVKIADEDKESRLAAVAKLAEGSASDVAQTLGRTVLLFKQKKKNSKIAIAKGTASKEPTAKEPVLKEPDLKEPVSKRRNAKAK